MLIFSRSRKVNQIDFGLSFDPTVSGARRRSHKTPTRRSSFNNDGYATRTPALRSRAASAQLSSQSKRRSSVPPAQPPTVANIEVQVPQTNDGRDQDGRFVAIPAQKRRKTRNASSRDTEGLPNGEDFVSEIGPTSKTNKSTVEPETLGAKSMREQYLSPHQPGSGQRKRKKRKSIGQQRKKRRSSGDGAVIDLDGTRNVLDEDTYPEVGEEVEAIGADEDFHESEYLEALDQEPLQDQLRDILKLSPRRSLPAPPSKRKKRRSIGQQRKKKRSSGGDNAVSGQDLPTAAGKFSQNEESAEELDGSDVESRVEENHRAPRSARQIVAMASLPGQDRGSLGVQPKRRKRKSIGQQRKKRRSSDRLPSNSFARYTNKLPNATDQEPESEIPQEDNHKDQEAQLSEVSDDDETFHPGDFDKGDESHLAQEPPTQRKKSKKASSTTRLKAGPPKRSSTTTVPILTHRLTNLSALPTITKDPSNPLTDTEADSASDPLTPSFTTHPTPNAING
ncbi:MAG: hypothetical protein Q9160_008869 [Pyrenula sp. 1 TL-2023]